MHDNYTGNNVNGRGKLLKYLSQTREALIISSCAMILLYENNQKTNFTSPKQQMVSKTTHGMRLTNIVQSQTMANPCQYLLQLISKQQT